MTLVISSSLFLKNSYILFEIFSSLGSICDRVTALLAPCLDDKDIVLGLAVGPFRLVGVTGVLPDLGLYDVLVP